MFHGVMEESSMPVVLTAEGARRCAGVQFIQAGSPLAYALVCDAGLETIDAMILLGLCAAPAGWVAQFR